MTGVFSRTLAFTIIAMTAFVWTLPAEAARCYESRSMCQDIEDLGDDEIKTFPNPLFLDVTSGELVDTWGEARNNGASHEGTDIFADRGSYIVMPTDGVVDRTGVSSLGGKHVFIYIGGGEKLYFAHLDDWADGLSEGDELEKGELVGYVGNSGATHTLPHLHLAIYEDGDAENPFPRMENKDWTLRQQIRYLDDIIEDADDKQLEAEMVFEKHGDIISEALADDIDIPSRIEDLIEDRIEKVEEKPRVDSDIEAALEYELFEENIGTTTNTSSAEIKRLQRFLNDVEDEDLSVDGKLNSQTIAAVKRFQEKYKRQVLDIWGLEEATGYVGITTRLKMNYLIQSGAVSCPVFSQYNSLTKNNSGDEVEETQKLLAELDFYDGEISGEFDQKTHEAMIDFQERFNATMLAPWGLTRGTGYKYKTTNKFMNYLRGCDTARVYLEGVGSYDF